MQRAIADLVHVGLDDVVALHLLQHFLINAHLPVSAIAVAARICAHTGQVRRTTQKHEDDHSRRNPEHKTLKTFGHISALDPARAY
jgi:hypothetical protein